MTHDWPGLLYVKAVKLYLFMINGDIMTKVIYGRHGRTRNVHAWYCTKFSLPPPPPPPPLKLNDSFFNDSDTEGDTVLPSRRCGSEAENERSTSSRASS